VGGPRDLIGNHVKHELLDELFEVVFRALLGHHVHHPPSDLSDLSAIRIASRLQLVLLLGGESDAEHPQVISVGGFNVDMGLDQCLPLFDERTELVSCQVHSVEVGEEVVSSDIFTDQFDLSEAKLFIVV